MILRDWNLHVRMRLEEICLPPLFRADAFQTRIWKDYSSRLGAQHFADAADHAALVVVQCEELKTIA
jgi:hypothetical protein